MGPLTSGRLSSLFGWVASTELGPGLDRLVPSYPKPRPQILHHFFSLLENKRIIQVIQSRSSRFIQVFLKSFFSVCFFHFPVIFQAVSKEFFSRCCFSPQGFSKGCSTVFPFPVVFFLQGFSMFFMCFFSWFFHYFLLPFQLFFLKGFCRSYKIYELDLKDKSRNLMGRRRNLSTLSQVRRPQHFDSCFSR